MSDPLWVQNIRASSFVTDARQRLKVALQPIVDVNSGQSMAYESLVRGYDDMGFPHPGAVFEHAASERRLAELELMLIDKAIEAYAVLRDETWSLLFVNLDGRLLPQWQDIRTFLELKADQLEIDPSDICIELSEQHQPLGPDAFADAVEGLRQPGFLIAIDDFGTGNSGMQMLYQSSPDFIKIDRFFIKSMADDPKKRLMVRSLVDLAHTLGARVIAEGVETTEELSTCREINCDMVQGFLIARPSTDISSLLPAYKQHSRPVAREGQFNGAAVDLDTGELSIASQIEDVVTLTEDNTLSDVMEYLANNPAQTVFPFIDKHGLPRGAVRERDVKKLIYSPFGRSLAQNPNIQISMKDYVKPITTLENATPLVHRLDLLADRAEDGIIVTEGLKYRGYLSSAALIKISNAQRLQHAASQNPLTHLPGNGAIQAFLGKCTRQTETRRVVAYLDLDNFKPFNDKYGFELGDRALVMLASILKSVATEDGVFVGHVGGDDFFLGAEGPACDGALDFLHRVGTRFAHVAESLYSQEDRDAGFILGRARDGSHRRFPLLTCTVAAVEVPAGTRPASTEAISTRLTVLKSTARREGKRMLTASDVAQAIG